MEMADASSPYEELERLETRLIYGYYPDIALASQSAFNRGEEKERNRKNFIDYL